MTIETMAKQKPETTPASTVVDQKVVAELVARAGAEVVSLTGEASGSSCSPNIVGERMHG